MTYVCILYNCILAYNAINIYIILKQLTILEFKEFYKFLKNIIIK